jgi:CRP-like cAMP-binding protein/Na+-translocating ferredoxin:NAD+ oxidoreductase RNF subunit RnfB
VIARLGGTPPRKFVESIGIQFPSNDPNAIPALSGNYESNVPGVYVVGALAGCPLIKQAMNQGYEVVEYIEGRAVEPADESLLRDRLKVLPRFSSVSAALEHIKTVVPLFSGLTTLQLREVLLDSTILNPKPGSVIFEYNDYTDTFYSIVNGTVEVQINPKDPKKKVPLGQGIFFGEMGLISGRRRTATVTAGNDCVLIETPRRTMSKLISSVASVKKIIDGAFLRRAIQAQIGYDTPTDCLDDLVNTARIDSFNSGDIIFKEGDPGDSLHLIRKGSVTISRSIGGRDRVLSYVASGNYIGEMALLTDSPRAATVRASISTETIRLDADAFKKVLKSNPALDAKLKYEAAIKLQKTAKERAMGETGEAGDIISFLVNQGLGEATDVLLIDESLCVRCDNCEKACAETHQGISRLDREAGPTYASLHVPTSCRHCEHPHCMKDCPPDAIHRNKDGEVFINEQCIGCGNCERNCPYGVIHMAVKEQPKPVNLFSWLLMGKGRAPGQENPHEHHPDAKKIATKCDMCKDLPGGSACVRACPTGAAIRVSPMEFIDVLRKNSSMAR